MYCSAHENYEERMEKNERQVEQVRIQLNMCKHENFTKNHFTTISKPDEYIFLVKKGGSAKNWNIYGTTNEGNAKGMGYYYKVLFL